VTSIDEAGPYPSEPVRIRFITCLGCEATVTQRPNGSGRWGPLICERCGHLNRESARAWYERRALLGDAA
jgi:hypothetical protein